MTVLWCLGCECNGNDRFSFPCGHVFCEDCCNKVLSGYSNTKSSSSVYLQQQKRQSVCPACYSPIDGSITSCKALKRAPKTVGLVVFKEPSLGASKAKTHDGSICKHHPNTSFTFNSSSGWVCKGCQASSPKSPSTPAKYTPRSTSLDPALITENFNPEHCGIHNQKIKKMSLSCSPYAACAACESSLPNIQGRDWFAVPSTSKELIEKSEVFMSQFYRLEVKITDEEEILKSSSEGLFDTITRFESDLKAHSPVPKLSKLFKKVTEYENEHREILQIGLKAKGHQRHALGKIKFLISKTEEFMNMKNFVRVAESIHFMNTLKENTVPFSRPLSILGYSSSQFLASTKLAASATVTSEPYLDQTNRASSNASPNLPMIAIGHTPSPPVASSSFPVKDKEAETSPTGTAPLVQPQTPSVSEPYGGHVGYGGHASGVPEYVKASGAVYPPPEAYTPPPPTAATEGAKEKDDASTQVGAEEAKKKDERRKSIGQSTRELVTKGAAMVTDMIHHVKGKDGKADTKVDDESSIAGVKAHEYAGLVEGKPQLVGNHFKHDNPDQLVGLIKGEEAKHVTPIHTPAGGHASPSISPAVVCPFSLMSPEAKRSTMETWTPPNGSVGGPEKEGNNPKLSPPTQPSMLASTHTPQELLSSKLQYFVSIFSANEPRKVEAMDKLKALHRNISLVTPLTLMHAFYVTMEQVAGKDILTPGKFDFDSSVFHISKVKSIDIQILSDISSPDIQAHFKLFLDTYKVHYSKVGDLHILTIFDLITSKSILLSNPFVCNKLKIEWSPLALYFRGITNMEIYQRLLSFFVTEKIDILSVTVEASQQSGERLVKFIFFNTKDILSVIALKKLQLGSAFVYISRDGKSFLGEERGEHQPQHSAEPRYKGAESHVPPYAAPPRSDLDIAESYMEGHHTPAPPPPMITSFSIDDFRHDILSRYIHICDHVRSWEYSDKIWSPQAWMNAFEEYESKRKFSTTAANPRGNLDEVRPMRILVMLNTIKLFRAGSYTNSKGQTIYIPPAGQNTFYREAPPIPTTLRPYRHTIQVINMDCLEAARMIMSESRGLTKVAVLNMASKFTPGGGYKKGDAAQEENLFRRTNYCTKLDSAWESENPNMSAQGYPMEPLGGAYTKSVTVFRGLESDGYPLLDEAFQCDFVAVFAIKSERNRQFGINEYHETQKKIETIFKICLHNGCEAVVLGALGCGAYNNPPKVVAEAFLSAVREYGHFFKQIVFAVKDDHNSANNFTIFKDTLDGVKIESGMSTSIALAHICRYGGLCREQGGAHSMQYRHPPPCPNRFCTNRDEAHRFYFSH